MKPKTKLLSLIFGFAVLVIVLLPWNTTVVPAVRVAVFDENGKPAAGVRVEQEWQYFTVNSEMQRATAATDAAGYVTLPKRTVRISAAGKALGWARSLLPLICSYDHGPFGSITAYGSDPRAYDIVVCDVNNPTPRPLKLTRWDLVVH